MKRINIKDYNKNMGELIDVQHPIDYMKNPTLGSINIYADKLLMDFKKYLDINKEYFIICKSGYLSKKVVATLEYYGYKVTQVVY